MKNTIKIGTRGSALALVQADIAANAIEAKTGFKCEKIIIKTKGDKNLNTPLEAFGGKGVFVDEFEELLLKGEIDIAVHSAKDMPIEIPRGLKIGAVLPRADERDVLVYKSTTTDFDIIGTSSKRRAAQIKRLYPSSRCKALRGNVPTRIERMKNGEYDAVVLAKAGLDRLDIFSQKGLKYTVFSDEQMIPAACQGIIAIECRENDIDDILSKINDKETERALIIEREIMNALDSSCTEAVGALYKNNRLLVMKEIDGELRYRQYTDYNLQKITRDFE